LNLAQKGQEGLPGRQKPGWWPSKRPTIPNIASRKFLKYSFLIP
jgi:hypothetical protein